MEQHSKFLSHTLQVLYMCALCDSTNSLTCRWKWKCLDPSCNCILVSQVYCVWQVVKTPTLFRITLYIVRQYSKDWQYCENIQKCRVLCEMYGTLLPASLWSENMVTIHGNIYIYIYIVYIYTCISAACISVGTGLSWRNKKNPMVNQRRISQTQYLYYIKIC
jgi:hypothetical protein